MSDICKTTNLSCIKCNPGPCDHRVEKEPSVIERIIARLKQYEEEYMFPDDDDYTCGQYDAMRQAIKIVMEEGGLNDCF